MHSCDVCLTVSMFYKWMRQWKGARHEISSAVSFVLRVKNNSWNFNFIRTTVFRERQRQHVDYIKIFENLTYVLRKRPPCDTHSAGENGVSDKKLS